MYFRLNNSKYTPKKILLYPFLFQLMGPNSSINYDNDNDDNVDYTASNTNSTGKMVVNGLLVVNEDKFFTR